MKVKNTPFKELPNGTEVVKIDAPIKTFISGRINKRVYTDDWYKRADGKIILDRKDGAFRLFVNEVEE